MLLRQLALGDRDKAGQAHFGGQQVVIAGVEAALADVVADRQQLGRRVVQEGVFDLREVARLACGLGDIAHIADRLFAPLRQQAGQLGQGAGRRFHGRQFAQGRHARERTIEARMRGPRRQLQQFGQGGAALARQRIAPHGQLAVAAVQGQRQQRVGRAVGRAQVGMPFGQAGRRGVGQQQRQRFARAPGVAVDGNEFLQHLRRGADAARPAARR